MTTPFWQLSNPLDAIIFDCDGTLSSIEGIDQLAEHNHVGDKVKLLTAEAMGKMGMNLSLFQERLALVQPRQQQLIDLAQEYFAHRTPDISAVIQTFQRCQKTIYLVSAGLNPAVALFGERLGIPRENIFAVDLHFDAQGNYLDFDKTTTLTNSAGKRDIVSKLKHAHPSLMFVGDGLNDYAAYDLVERFIGYGGAYYRQNIADLCQFYMSSPSLTTLLPLGLTLAEFEKLTTEDNVLYQRGLELLNQSKLNKCEPL